MTWRTGLETFGVLPVTFYEDSPPRTITVEITDAEWAAFKDTAKVQYGWSPAELLGWRVKREVDEWLAMPTCEKCGKKFKPTRKDSRYCSTACRQKAYRQRRAGGF